MSACTPRVYGSSPGAPRRSGSSAGRSDSVYSGLTSIPESVNRRGSSGPTIGATVRRSSVAMGGRLRSGAYDARRDRGERAGPRGLRSRAGRALLRGRARPPGRGALDEPRGGLAHGGRPDADRPLDAAGRPRRRARRHARALGDARPARPVRRRRRGPARARSGGRGAPVPRLRREPRRLRHRPRRQRGRAVDLRRGEPPGMKVTVRLFAILRQRAGRDTLELELPEGARVADALAAVDDLAGGLRLVMAVNREYAAADDPLAAGDELALIPPVSGGATTAPHVAIRDEPLSL